jgi:dTDP-glucose 4,6-dehydratase
MFASTYPGFTARAASSRRLAHVVGLRLEREAPDGEGAAGEVLAEPLDHAVQQHPLLRGVHPLHAVQDRAVQTEAVERVDQRLDVLREAAPAVPDPREEEGRADPVVGAHALPDHRDVRAHRLAEPAIMFMKEIRVASIAFAAYFVISALAMSMKRIGLPVRTKGPYSSPSFSRAKSESTPTTTRSGFMKSWTAAPSFRNSGLEQTCTVRAVWRAIASRTRRAVPTGDGALGDHDLLRAVLRHVPPDRLGHREHVLEVGAPVLARRRPHGDEDDLAGRHRAGHVGGEAQPAVGQVPLDQRLQTRLVDRDLAGLQPRDLPLIDVAADHVVPGLGETGAHDESDVMRILITGAAGFLGSHLCDRFLAEGHDVIGMDNFITGSPDNIAHLIGTTASASSSTTSRTTSTSRAAGRRAPLRQPRQPGRLPGDADPDAEGGQLGTHKTLGLAKAKGARYLSPPPPRCTATRRSTPSPRVLGQREPRRPRGVYDEAKRFAEAMTMAYHRFHGVDVRIVRIFNTYGPACGRRRPRRLQLHRPGAARRAAHRLRRRLPDPLLLLRHDEVDGIYRLFMSDDVGPVNIGNPGSSRSWSWRRRSAGIRRSHSMRALDLTIPYFRAEGRNRRRKVPLAVRAGQFDGHAADFRGAGSRPPDTGSRLTSRSSIPSSLHPALQAVLHTEPKPDRRDG